ncbi:uncharacterized protein BJ212DRAFT_1303410 [Suillus subaureus]|uniref:Uncharacterized protein n=1 Tax=Suillus subaureus TaxID=48587 RepID=A0A9P7J7S0_9AGAM|nr:uncharacterized protein BJ212DRAFT_1303410 [Suillus subaureus]KAG1807431.1 hypothetical protein BJ212DRAFT_1303410 [Suillus subaureus]
MSTEDRIIFRQGISSGFAGLEVASFEHNFSRFVSNPQDLSISSQTRQQYEPLLSAAAAPLIISNGAAEIDRVFNILQKIRNPVRQDPAVEQGAPPLNYYKTSYGITFIRGGELVWSNYLPERGVRPPISVDEDTASAEEESQFGDVVNILQSLVQRSQAA